LRGPASCLTDKLAPRTAVPAPTECQRPMSLVDYVRERGDGSLAALREHRDVGVAVFVDRDGLAGVLAARAEPAEPAVRAY
jgi:hypothetical protein